MTSWLFGGNNKNTPAFTNMSIQTSAYNIPIMLGWGRNRITHNVIWMHDLFAYPVIGGGKGGGGGQVTGYNYTVAILLALGQGEISAISKVFIDNSTTTLAEKGLTLFTGSTSQAPFSYISTNFPAEALSYRRTAYLAASAFSLGGSTNVPAMGYEAVMRLSGTDVPAGVYDANPSAILFDLTTQIIGPLIDGAAILDYSDYCRAQGIWLSPIILAQEKICDVIDRWAILTNSWIFWTGEIITIKPLGDKDLSANGATWSPDMSVCYDLTVSDFLTKSGSPVKINRKDPADCYNRTSIQINDQVLDYSSNLMEYRDATLFARHGLVDNSVIRATEITDATVGQTITTLVGKRAAYSRNTYEFTLPFRFIRLLPGDLVTLTDPNISALTQLLVRIVTVDEDNDYSLNFLAEEVSGTIGRVNPSPIHVPDPYVINQFIDPGDVNPPAIFEPNSALTNGFAQVWVAVSGGQNWGGADVYLSLDGGSSYSVIGTITNGSKQGVLTADLASHADPDAVNTLAVDLTVSQGILEPSTHDDADAFRTLCLIAPTAATNGELIAYGDTITTGTYTADLDYLRRGLYGSTIGAHDSADQFTFLNLASLGDQILSYDLSTQYIGQAIHVKFVSFNIYGLGYQDISGVTDYVYTPAGSGYGAGTAGVPLTPTGLAATGGTQQVLVAWAANAVTDNVTAYLVYRAPGTGSAFGASALVATVNSLTWTDVSVDPDTGYTYFLKAQNAAGLSSATAGDDATTAGVSLSAFGFAVTVPDISTQPVSTIISRFVSRIEWTIPAGMTDSGGRVTTAPGANTDFDILRNGVSVGTARWETGSTSPIFIMAAPTALVNNDYVDVVTPANFNGMAGPFGLTIMGTKT